MRSPYAAPSRLARGGPVRLGETIALTDPNRTPDPVRFAEHLAPGTTLIYRHFGADDRIETALVLSRLAQMRGLFFLVSADEDLARLPGLHGLHWPERMMRGAITARRRGDDRVFTAAAHSRRAIGLARQCGMDVVLISPVFPSASPSATRPLGAFSAAALARNSSLPAYALGGVSPARCAQLQSLGFSGIAGIDGFTA